MRTKEMALDYQIKWRRSNPNYHKRWQEAHPGYKEKKAEENRSRTNAQRILLGAISKTLVLTHYGKGKLACSRCGFDDIRALSLDHINGGGSALAREAKKNHKRVLSGQALYRTLYLLGFPAGFQTLCMNCKFIKRVESKEQI